MAEMLEYASALTSLTGGKGAFRMEFSHYEEVPAQLREKIVAEAQAAAGAGVLSRAPGTAARRRPATRDEECAGRVTAPAKIKLTLSPQAERYVRRDAPVEVRRLAATRRAAARRPSSSRRCSSRSPTTPTTRSRRARGRASSRCRRAVCDAVLSGETHPAVLGYLAHACKDDAARLEKIALNPAADDRTFVFLAALPHKRVVEIVANNQTRLLRCSEIAEALGENPRDGTLDHRPHPHLPRLPEARRRGRRGRPARPRRCRRPRTR